MRLFVEVMCSLWLTEFIWLGWTFRGVFRRS